MFDSKRVEAIRRGTQAEPDDRAARYLIDELVKTCIRDPNGRSLTTRYDESLTALEAACDRLDIHWRAAHPSLRAFGKAVDMDDIPAIQQRAAASAQFESLLDALDGERELVTAIDVEAGAPLTGWERVDRQIVALRERFATASSEVDYSNLGRQCREVFVSLADAAYDEELHGPLPEPDEGAGRGDVKRRLETVVRTSASGGADAALRAVITKTLDLANKLQHRQTTSAGDAATMCDATINAARAIRRLVD